MRLDKLSKVAVEALEDIKGRDIVVLDVRKMTALFDKVIIATAESSRQAKAMADNVQVKAKAAGARVLIEGEQTGEWVLVDLGSVVVHVMLPAIREYYNLEELWTPPKARTRRATSKTA